MESRPRLSFWQIWNMCFGFLGIQFGFALQNANVSRIFQTLGADIEQVPGLWIAAPLTGLLVQPVVGYFSDRTWTGLGRRRPYFLAGAILATLALLVMPNSPTLWIAAGTLWILDASINVSMEPFRAFVGDQLPPSQRASGYAMQSFFIGIGAIVASLLPWLLAKAGVANTAAPGEVPDTVRFAFYAGGAVLLAAIGWTVLRTREYPPEVLASFADTPPVATAVDHAASRAPVGAATAWLLAGLALGAVIAFRGWDRMLYVLAGMLAAYGVLLLAARALPAGGMVPTIVADLRAMPGTMRRLAVVQFFSLVRPVRDVDLHHRGGRRRAFRQQRPDVGGVQRRRQLGRGPVRRLQRLRRTGRHRDPVDGARARPAGEPPWSTCGWARRGCFRSCWCAIRSGCCCRWSGSAFAWASILSLPYAMLSDSVPATKMGVYMGIFNFFIVIPQLVAASLLGFLLKWLFGGQPLWALVLGGASLLLAGLCVLAVPRIAAAEARA